MKEYRVEMVATKKVVITEEMWVEEGGAVGDLDEFSASQFAKGMLVKELINDPNRGSVKVERIK